MTTIKETRPVEKFNSIELRGFGELFLQQNQEPGQAESLEIEADEALLPKITSQVKNGRLILGLEPPGWNLLGWIDWMTLPKEARFTVNLNQVSELAVSGSGVVKAGPLTTEKLRLTISGSGKMDLEEVTGTAISTVISGSGKMKLEKIQVKSMESMISGAGEYHLAGKADQHVIRVSGSGKILASELETEQTIVKISGSGYASLIVNQSLEVSISGSAEIIYKGNPSITQNVSGSGKVLKAS